MTNGRTNGGKWKIEQCSVGPETVIVSLIRDFPFSVFFICLYFIHITDFSFSVFFYLFVLHIRDVVSASLVYSVDGRRCGVGAALID